MGVVVDVDVENKARTQVYEVCRVNIQSETRLYFCESKCRSISGKMVTVNTLVKKVEVKVEAEIDILRGNRSESCKSVRIIILNQKCKIFLEVPTY